MIDSIHRGLPQDEDLHDLIAERYERHATIITSKFDLPEWGDAFPNSLLGATTIDRLRYGAYKLVMERKSYRSMKSDLKNTQSKSSQKLKNAVAKGGEKR